MSLAIARQLDDIDRRLDQLEAASRVRYSKSAAGAYLPTYFGATTAGVTTYTTQTGDWSLIGRVAFVSGRVAWTAATGTGAARVGLPGNLVPAADSVGTVWTNLVTFANSGIQCIVQQSGGGVLRFFSPLTNAASTELAIEAAGEIRFAIWYFI